MNFACSRTACSRTGCSRTGWHICLAVTFAFLLYFGSGALLAQAQPQPAGLGTIPSPNRIVNGEFECGEAGYYAATNSRGETILLPNGWTLAATSPYSVPILSSARIWFEGSKGNCTTSNAHVERISGRDSLFVSSLDIETPPEPGKPFDVSIYQQVDAYPGAAYSLSGWLLTLCGGSAVPTSCPSGYYMAKMLGIDPTGGTDPNSPNVVWGENRNNFVTPDNQRIGWANVRTSAVAQADKITVFARINSPFRWHGNHGFIDALALVRAPVASLSVATATLGAGGLPTVTVQWDGALGDDIQSIPHQNFQLLFDVQYFHPSNNEWRTLKEGAAGAGSLAFTAKCVGDAYQFRVRARAEQPDGNNGSLPNQRYVGVWSDPVSVPVLSSAVLAPRSAMTATEWLYLPAVLAQGDC